jgi:hypothetical protein
MPAENPICASCGVEYVPEYEGPCQEPGCTGRVSWKATADHLAARLAEVMSEWGEDQRDREKAVSLLREAQRSMRWENSVPIGRQFRWSMDVDALDPQKAKIS